MWFGVVCALTDGDMRHHSGQNVVDSRGAPQQILSTVMTHIIADRSVDSAEPHSICFFPQY